VEGDEEHANSGLLTCGLPAVMLSLPSVPPCSQAADVVYGRENSPLVAAATFFDGLADPHAAIYMNALYETTPAILVHGMEHEVGSVLLHEMGHYAFGALDLYVGDQGDCYVEATGISVMSASRAAREFDDEATRCPNEAAIPGYVPSWTKLRERFPLVPDRAGPAPGPSGDGGGYAYRAFGAFAVSPPDPPQDDAGSGRDAPDAPDPSFLVDLGVVHSGALLGFADGDPADHYAFEAEGTVVVTVLGRAACFPVLDADGHPVPAQCDSVGRGEGMRMTATLPARGVYVAALRAFLEAPEVHRLSVRPA
ncbi:MAG TPA: hypothetical protein VHH36_01080, partial [Candidatus Thermoplasmatota archaeon]|nr:hypothetical protein [Candidatus Thermoplasmatota archaeon]